MSEPVRVLIVGAGAVGCFYASRMHKEPHVLVSLVCRSNYAAIKANGVFLKTHSFGDYYFCPEHVFNSVQAAAETKLHWDYVVVTAKALPNISDDSVLIAPVVDKDSSIVLIQNGVGVEEPYRRRFPLNPVLSAVTIISAEQVEQGVIRQNRWTRISIGPYTNGLPDPDSEATKLGDTKTAEFMKLLQDGGINDAEMYDERGLQFVRWHKIAINGTMNPSSVLSNGTGNARMSLDPELRIHLKAGMEEVFHAAEAVLGAPMPNKLATADQILTSTERNVSGRPSMLLDWYKGAPMELEVILGNPVRLARAKGAEMPRLQAMYGLLKMAQTRRDEENAERKRKAQAKL